MDIIRYHLWPISKIKNMNMHVFTKQDVTQDQFFMQSFAEEFSFS